MTLIKSLLVIILLAHVSAQGPSSFDCAMRKYAYEYGKSLIPRAGKFEDLYLALGLNVGNCTVGINREQIGDGGNSRNREEPQVEFLDKSIHVHPELGDDNADGTYAAPLRTIQYAVDLAAKVGISHVLLREGTYYLRETIQFGPEHSNITLQNCPGEQAVISGGQLLKTNWKPFSKPGLNATNMFEADIKGQVPDVPGLQLNGVRATRARYPNAPHGVEVSQGYGGVVSGFFANWTPPQFHKFPPVQYYTDTTPAHLRNNTPNGWFQEYMIGWSGLCSVYDPPVSYWCSEHPSGGGAFAFRTPSGVTPIDNALPNSPYDDVSQMIWNIWRPSRWANWMFEVGSYDKAKNNFTFGYGGFQGARGSNTGGDFFVENVWEEFDYPGEFFYNKSTEKLYLYYNGTGAPPSDLQVVAPQLQVLLNISGTQWNPVKSLSVSGIKFTASAYTYMMPHGVPSGGDWALERYASVFLQGTEHVTISDCSFERLDGNAVMVSGYNRYATIDHSEFAYIGGNAIAAWGYTNETTGDNYPKAGVDGTDGNHPRYTTVFANIAREVGLYEKQSSFFVQAKTAESNITGNVFFNGPRAGINSNDGFGGGDVIAHNLVFSTCRESGDHGPFNSWDRQPFLTTVRDGTPSMIMAYREIHHNFFIDNYSPQENVDNDDGSGYYYTHHNFLVYGNNGMKSDFGGHDNNHYNNIYAYVGEAMNLGTAQLDGHQDNFYNNTVVLTGTNVGTLSCKFPGKTMCYNNNYFTSDGTVTECNVSLQDWQKSDPKQNEVNSTVTKYPSDNTIIEWARATLEG